MVRTAGAFLPVVSWRGEGRPRQGTGGRVTSSVAFARQDERRVISNVTKGSIGNLIEWYDWYTYATFSVYFAATFFPEGNATAQLLSTAAIFAVGFLMRP